MPSGVVFLQCSSQHRSWQCGALKAMLPCTLWVERLPALSCWEGLWGRREVAVPDLGPGSQQSLCTSDWHSWSVCHFVSVLCVRKHFLWDCLSSDVGFIAGPCVWNLLCSEINHLWKHRGSAMWPRLSSAWHYVSPTDVKYCTTLLRGLSGISLAWKVTFRSNSLSYGIRAGTCSCDLWYGKK